MNAIKMKTKAAAGFIIFESKVKGLIQEEMNIKITTSFSQNKKNRNRPFYC
jgi:hypothetical protein